MRPHPRHAIVAIAAGLMLAIPLHAPAASSVDFFNAVVETGPVTQSTSGADNRQTLNVGSAASTTAERFDARVTTGSISQSSSGSGIVQNANIGSASNSRADSFKATVVTGDIEQISNRSGERQELDIGSLTNSNVNGDFKADVTVRDGVRQTGSGEIVLGSVKNSNINSDFSTTLVVDGTVSGNNIKIGSIVGGERFDEEGNAGEVSSYVSKNNTKNTLRMPNFINSSVPSNVQSEKDFCLEKPKILSYGNYCGPKWTGGQTATGNSNIDFRFKPEDSIDELCMYHDKEYRSDDPQKRYEADKLLLEGLLELNKKGINDWKDKPENNTRAKAYLISAIGLFDYKVKKYEEDQENIRAADKVVDVLSEIVPEKISNVGGNLIFNYVVGDVSNLSHADQAAIYFEAAENIDHTYDVTASATANAMKAAVDIYQGDTKGAVSNTIDLIYTLQEEATKD